jgi:DNA-binding transcriptional ArsR family regulator
MAEVAKALGDPVRVQLVDVLRRHAGKVCVCELVPLFDISLRVRHGHGQIRATSLVVSDRRDYAVSRRRDSVSHERDAAALLAAPHRCETPNLSHVRPQTSHPCETGVTFAMLPRVVRDFRVAGRRRGLGFCERQG